MKKKSLFLVFALILSVSLLAGCTKSGASQVAGSETKDKLSIVTTTFAPYDFARQVAGEYGEVTMLVPPAAESHSYEPTPQDIIKIQNCDVFIYGGGESDDWVTKILDSIGSDHIKIIKMLDCVTLVEEEIVEGMQEDEHEHGAHEETDAEHQVETEHMDEEHTEADHEADAMHAEEEHHDEAEEIVYDEHVWTSPKNSIKIVEAIAKTLSDCDLSHEEVYMANSAAYIRELEALDTAFRAVVDSAQRKEVIFADRFPLRYFVEEYGLSYYAAFPGCSTETEPSAATVAFLIDKVKEDEIPVVFHIELSNEKMADTICEATGAKKLLFNACHTISKTDFESGITYLDIMRENIAALEEALN